MCLLSAWKPHILPLDHSITINGMIWFHLQWWMNTSRFALGTSIHPSDPNIFLFTDASHYGWGAHLEPMRLSFHGRWTGPIPAPYQHVRNDGHTLSTETSHNIYSPFFCHDFHRQHYGGLLYQQSLLNSFSQSLRRSVGDPQFLPGNGIVIRVRHIPGKFNIFSRPPIQIGQTNQNRIGSGSIGSEFSILDALFSQCGFACDSFQSQNPVVCHNSSRQSCASSGLSIYELGLSSCLCFSSYKSDSFLEKIRQYQCRIVLIVPFWPQQMWFPELLKLLVSAPIRLLLFPRLLTQSKGRFLHQNLPVLDLHA